MSTTNARRTVLAIPGSLRRRSHNRSLLEAATALSPEQATLDVYERLGELPLFNEDLEVDDGPTAVSGLRRAVAGADGLIIATPEYNQSVPGVVKNMIDWLSRSEPGPGLAGKPVAITGATTGPWGTRISQTTLRQMLASTGALVLPTPMLFVARAGTVFNEQGRLVDAGVAEALADLLAAFVDWIDLVTPPTRHV